MNPEGVPPPGAVLQDLCGLAIVAVDQAALEISDGSVPGHLAHETLRPLLRLQDSHSSWTLRSVLLPPSATGIMWSNSSFWRPPQPTHLPPSRCQTKRRTASGSSPDRILRQGYLAARMLRSRVSFLRTAGLPA